MQLHVYPCKQVYTTVPIHHFTYNELVFNKTLCVETLCELVHTNKRGNTSNNTNMGHQALRLCMSRYDSMAGKTNKDSRTHIQTHTHTHIENSYPMDDSVLIFLVFRESGVMVPRRVAVQIRVPIQLVYIWEVACNFLHLAGRERHHVLSCESEQKRRFYLYAHGVGHMEALDILT